MSAAWTVVALGDGRFAAAIVHEDVPGYAIDSTRAPGTWQDVQASVCAGNAATGVSTEDAWRVVASSMRASRAAGARWGPRGPSA